MQDLKVYKCFLTGSARSPYLPILPIFIGMCVHFSAVLIFKVGHLKYFIIFCFIYLEFLATIALIDDLTLTIILFYISRVLGYNCFNCHFESNFQGRVGDCHFSNI